jgi:hypothetical protein
MENLYLNDAENELVGLCSKMEVLGTDWAEAQAISDQLEDMKKVVLARLSGGTGSYVERERAAFTSKEYEDHITAISEAKRDAGTKKVRYNAIQAKIDALRTIISNKRAMLQRGIE